MTQKAERLPLDARLLCNAVIELNISRHIISLYPGNHGLVQKALDRAFDILVKLFELRREITLAVAKDTLIVDEHALDRKNPVYRQFALALSRMCVASVTFVKGIRREEVYSFHRFLSRGSEGLPAEKIPEILKEYDLIHILVEPMDFRKFTFLEGERQKEGDDEFALERYIKGLLEGTLLDDGASEMIEAIPPEVLAGLINRSGLDEVPEKAYDTVISSYLRRSSGRAFSGKELGKLLVFIGELRPELKKQFLSFSVKGFGHDLETLHRALEGVSVEKVIGLLGSIEEHCVALPEPLRNLLMKFAQLAPGEGDDVAAAPAPVADDIHLSPEMINLFRPGEGGAQVPDSYRDQIAGLLEGDFAPAAAEGGVSASEWEEDFVLYSYVKVFLEVLSSPFPHLIPTTDYILYAELLSRLADQVAGSGQYALLYDLLTQMERNAAANRHAGMAKAVTDHCHDEDFLSRLVASFPSRGRMNRGAAMMLCDHYGEEIVPYLFDILGAEESAGTRKFLVSLFVRLGDKVLKESLRRLADRRWYVRRNILYILGESTIGDKAGSIRPFCRDPDPRVRLEAARCLVKAGDGKGVAVLRDLIRSSGLDIVESAIAAAGSLKVSDLLPDLREIVKKTGVRRSDYQQKIAAVKAIGQIGDPRAGELLKDINEARGILYPRETEKLKETARKALHSGDSGS